MRFHVTFDAFQRQLLSEQAWLTRDSLRDAVEKELFEPGLIVTNYWTGNKAI